MQPEIYDPRNPTEIDREALFAPPTPEELEPRPVVTPASFQRDELLTVLSERTVDALDPMAARNLGYELQRLASAIDRGRAAQARWRELCLDERQAVEPNDLTTLGHKLLRYAFTLRRSQ